MQNYGKPRTVRMEKDAVNIVQSCPGRNFSEKLRYVIDKFRAQNPEIVENTRREWQSPELFEGGAASE